MLMPYEIHVLEYSLSQYGFAFGKEVSMNNFDTEIE